MPLRGVCWNVPLRGVWGCAHRLEADIFSPKAAHCDHREHYISPKGTH